MDLPTTTTSTSFNWMASGYSRPAGGHPFCQTVADLRIRPGDSQRFLSICLGCSKAYRLEYVVVGEGGGQDLSISELQPGMNCKLE